jgi:hypothetical protein
MREQVPEAVVIEVFDLIYAVIEDRAPRFMAYGFIRQPRGRVELPG